MADTEGEEPGARPLRIPRNGKSRGESKSKSKSKIGSGTFRFITTTEKPQSINASAELSRTVRSHAIRSFLDGRNTPDPDLQPPPTAVVNSKPGMFKLSTWSRKPRSKSTKSKETDEKPTGSKEIAVQQKTPLAREGSSSNPLSLAKQSLNLATSQLNNLGSLPIPQGGSIQSLVHHYVTRYKMNVFALNYNSSWLSFSFSDAAILNATLYCVAQHRNLLWGTPNSSDALLYKGETLKIINDRLLHEREHLSDGTIASVAVLNNWESMSGSYDASKAHMDGLAMMVAMRGGLSAFKGIVFNLLAYSDTLYCTRWSSALRFAIPSFSQASSVQSIISRQSSGHALLPSPEPISAPNCLVRENELCQHSQPYEETFTARFSQTEHEILVNLRSITQSMTLPGLTASDKKTISDLIYSTEYNILTSTNQQETNPLTIDQAFSVAAMLYLQLMIREVPILAKAFNRLLLKLLAFLDIYDTREADRDEENDDLFMWIVFIAASTASFPVLERYFPAPNAEEVETGNEDRMEEFRVRLKRVVWREGICDEYLARAWNERKR